MSAARKRAEPAPVVTLHHSASDAWTRYKPNMDRPCYLGIDPGTNCGWALVAGHNAAPDSTQPRTLIGAGCWHLSARTGEGAGMRFLRLRNWLSELLADNRPIAMGYELVRDHSQSRPGPGPGGRVRSYNTQAAHVYGGIVATIASVCEEIGCPYATFEVAQIKRHATGKGNAGKPAMVAAAQACTAAGWSKPVDDDNEADARWIADLLRAGLEIAF